MTKQDPNYCKDDYMGQHCWKPVGVCRDKNIFVEIFKCMQCKKCLKKKLEFVEEKKELDSERRTKK